MSKEVTTVNLDEELVEWADNNHAELGYRSRSSLLNDLLKDCRAEHADGVEA
jgi:metal-responsive CopG/Arc/MetJ family transcriptional regulator